MIRRARRGPLALFLAATLGAAATAHEDSVRAPGYAALEFAAPPAGTYQLPRIGAASDAEYVDADGRRGRLHDLYAGHVTILSFIYTQCDDVNGCPLATFVMAQIAKRLRADPRMSDKLRLISFSFDLERDTPAVLANYARAFRPPGSDWHFVTAPGKAALALTLTAYQQSIRQSAGHAFAHILRVFLVDSSKQIRNIYSATFLHADTLAADVATVLLEPGELDAAAVGTGDARAVDGSAPLAVDAWLGLPRERIIPAPTAAERALGERLFFDRRLSLNGTLSCAMCHVPAQGFAVNELATAVGIEGRTVKRNAPTLLNVGFLTRLFHDARENRLEQQVWAPLLAANEMANPSIGFVVDHLERWPKYPALFQAAYGTGPGMETIGRALAAYERTLVAGGSAFDRWYYGKDTTALDLAAQRGFALFRGKARCSACHTVGARHALFTDERLHNTGLGYAASMVPATGRRIPAVAPGTAFEYDLAAVAHSAERPPQDLGRYEVTQDPDDRWKFRTPSLRNVALTGPYMHNGALSTLEEVVEFYERGGIANDLLDPLIKPLGLSAAERRDLVSFLRSLTSPAVAALVERARVVEIGNPTTDMD